MINKKGKSILQQKSKKQCEYLHKLHILYHSKTNDSCDFCYLKSNNSKSFVDNVLKDLVYKNKFNNSKLGMF